MINRIVSAASGFVGGFFTLAVVNDGANGFLPGHFGIALVAVTVAGFSAAFGD